MDESLVLFIYQISSVIAAILFNFNKILTTENDNYYHSTRLIGFLHYLCKKQKILWKIE